MKDCIYNNVCTSNECIGCVRYIEMSALLEQSLLPLNMQKIIELYPDDVDYDKFVELKSIKGNIKSWVESGDFNLLIYSKFTGNGKTSWAVKMLLKYFDEIWAGNGLEPRGLFISVPKLLNRLKDFSAVDYELGDLKKLITLVDLVVWDDIAAIKPSDWDNSQLLNYIDDRILSGKSNIFTANVGNQDLRSILGNRLYSRVWTNSIRIELFGRDRREHND